VAQIEVLAQSLRAGVDAHMQARLVHFVEIAQESLLCALFDLQNPPVIAALAAARRRGVTVTVLTDPVRQPHDPSRADPEALAALGPGLLDASAPRGAGIIHHKYLVRDGDTVWTGSANVSDGAFHRQDNDTVIVRSTAVASIFAANFRSVQSWRDDAPMPPAPTPTGPGSSSDPVPLPDGSLYARFTPGSDIADDLHDRILAARHIRLAFYILSDRYLIGALKRASDAGADIAGVYDPNGMAVVVKDLKGDDRRFWFLHDPRFAPAPSHPYVPGGQQDFLHNKLVILDREVVVTGSYNFSAQARHNAENVIVADSPSTASAYLAYWERLATTYGLPVRHA